jgi:hypothetical protein
LALPRYHDLAQFGDMVGRCDPPKRSRGTSEETPETRREMAMARKSCIEGDGSEIVTTV